MICLRTCIYYRKLLTIFSIGKPGGIIRLITFSHTAIFKQCFVFYTHRRYICCTCRRTGRCSRRGLWCTCGGPTPIDIHNCVDNPLLRHLTIISVKNTKAILSIVSIIPIYRNQTICFCITAYLSGKFNTRRGIYRIISRFINRSVFSDHHRISFLYKYFLQLLKLTF